MGVRAEGVGVGVLVGRGVMVGILVWKSLRSVGAAGEMYEGGIIRGGLQAVKRKVHSARMLAGFMCASWAAVTPQPPNGRRQARGYSPVACTPVLGAPTTLKPVGDIRNSAPYNPSIYQR